MEGWGQEESSVRHRRRVMSFVHPKLCSRIDSSFFSSVHFIFRITFPFMMLTLLSSCVHWIISSWSGAITFWIWLEGIISILTIRRMMSRISVPLFFPTTSVSSDHMLGIRASNISHYLYIKEKSELFTLWLPIITICSVCRWHLTSRHPDHTKDSILSTSRRHHSIHTGGFVLFFLFVIMMKLWHVFIFRLDVILSFLSFTLQTTPVILSGLIPSINWREGDDRETDPSLFMKQVLSKSKGAVSMEAIWNCNIHSSIRFFMTHHLHLENFGLMIIIAWKQTTFFYDL